MQLVDVVSGPTISRRASHSDVATPHDDGAHALGLRT
jgi:hypothetical protein